MRTHCSTTDKIAVDNKLIRKSSFAPNEANKQLFKLQSYQIYCNALQREKLTLRFHDTCRRLMQVPRSTSASRVFAENGSDHIKILFCKAAHSLMKRVTASNNKILAAICTGDALAGSLMLERWREILDTQEQRWVCPIYDIFNSIVLSDFFRLLYSFPID